VIVALVPLKALSEAKSRLASVLGNTERRELVECLLAGTIRALRDSDVIDRIALISPEQLLAQCFGVVWLPDAGGLNESLAAGVDWALAQSASGLLIVPADLPGITPADVRAIVSEAPNQSGICLTPTRDGGTGALFLRPPDTIRPQFGSDSFRRHRKTAQTQGAAIRVLSRPGLALDLDTPADLSLLHTKNRLSCPKTTGGFSRLTERRSSES
jgi:2-phospho-L-lactate guanylyltransferase